MGLPLPISSFVDNQILERIAQVYRRGGPVHARVPARSFLDTLSQEQLTLELGTLLDDGTLLACAGGTVMLSAGLRASTLTRPVLTGWVEEAWSSALPVRELLLAAIRTELTELVAHCSTAAATEPMLQRGAELMGVLTMSDLNPEAVNVIAGLNYPPRAVMKDLSAVAPGSCRTVNDLRAVVRRDVVTTFFDRA